MKILVTGSNGQLGSEFKKLSKTSIHQFFFADFTKLDITDIESIKSFFKENPPDFILNCAAYTAVDKAEDEKKKAFSVNKTGVLNLVEICEKYNIKLIHFSTDYVFDGKNHRPYKESDCTKPNSVYGKSKLEGENIIMQSDISALIIRTSWLYSVYGNNFVKTMINLGQSKDEISVVFDQIGTPTNARDLAEATMKCLKYTKNWENTRKIYHFSNEGVASWYDFAKVIFDTYKLKCFIFPVLSNAYPTKAKRPYFSVLDKSKFKEDFKVTIKHWKSSFQSCEFNYES